MHALFGLMLGNVTSDTDGECTHCQWADSCVLLVVSVKHLQPSEGHSTFRTRDVQRY
jgi:hypothetical protein